MPDPRRSLGGGLGDPTEAFGQNGGRGVRGETAVRTLMPWAMPGRAVASRFAHLRAAYMQRRQARGRLGMIVRGVIASDVDRLGESMRRPRGAGQKKRKHQRASSHNGECRTELPTHGAQL